MRCLYRERRYYCGDYLEVDIFPVFKKQNGRGKKAKPTSEVQAKLNQHNAEQKLIRILNENFTLDDIEIHLTYSDENLPETPEEVIRDYQNYLRRVKRLRSTLEDLWGYGYANSKRLQFNENGVEGLARYIARQFVAHEGELPFGKRWSGSRNLVIPPPKDRDGKISQKKARELATVDSDSREAFERLYEGYRLSEVRPFYNEVNGGYYLHVKLYRDGSRFANNRKRKRRDFPQNE